MSERSRQQVRFMKSSSEKGKLYNILIRAGIGQKESQIYLHLLEKGPLSITALAYTLAIPRTTIHENVEKLKEKGMVKAGNRKISAEPIEKLKLIVLQRQIELERRSKEISNLNKDLESIVSHLSNIAMSPKPDDPTKVFFYEGKSGIESVYWDTYSADEVRSFVDLDKFFEIFPYDGDISNMLTDALRENTNRHVWDIAIDTDFARRNVQRWERYKCRFFPHKEASVGFDIQIYENKLGFVKLNEPMSAVLIQSEVYSHIVRIIHQAMWPLMLE